MNDNIPWNDSWYEDYIISLVINRLYGEDNE